MMEPQRNDRSPVSEPSMSPVKSDDGSTAPCRKPEGLTITVERIDRMLADVQVQIERLRRERTDLEIIRGQLAAMESRWGGA